MNAQTQTTTPFGSLSPPSSVRWRATIDLAATTLPHDAWRSTLAMALREAAAPMATFCTVVTCVPGDWCRLHWTSDPESFDEAIEILVNDVVPRIDKAETWRALQAHGPVLAPLSVMDNRRLAEQVKAKIFAPRDVDGVLVAYCLDRSGQLVALLAIGSVLSSGMLAQSLAEPLARVAAVAGRTLAGAVALAKACGAVAPTMELKVRELTSRQRQIVGLLAEGLRDAEIGRRLGIEEHTVRTHLKKIYRSLEVSSRAQLMARLLSPR